MTNRPLTPDNKPDTKDAIAGFARAGYASRGIVYLIIGGLAALAALGRGGETTDSQGALLWVLEAPLGDILLGALALGLVGYSGWRAIQAVKDTDDHGAGAKGITIRGGLAVSAVTHLVLAFFAINLIFALGTLSGSDSDNGSSGIADWVMGLPFGRWLFVIAGLAIIGAGVAHAIKGAKTQFHKHFDMPSHMQRWAYPVCRFGLVTRGLVFGMVGTFFLIAAYEFDPDEAGGTAEVFSTLQEQIYGQWLLAFVAVGLFAFGVYSLLQAVYRRVNPSS